MGTQVSPGDGVSNAISASLTASDPANLLTNLGVVYTYPDTDGRVVFGVDRCFDMDAGRHGMGVRDAGEEYSVQITFGGPAPCRMALCRVARGQIGIFDP